ncbi:MAG TPA: hypothetical protein VK961_04120 [Chthoniobacter sp.]|nr:hypothetical protein [Chthoniobacter sp.]
MTTTSIGSRSRFLSFVLLCMMGSLAHAGTPITDSKETKGLVPAETDPWKFTLAVPGWLAATSGTIGLNGTDSHVYIGADTLIKHLDMTASLSAEARKGRFGIYGDMLYVKASDTVTSEGLIGTAKVHLDQWLADLEVNYRVMEGPKGYLDVRAGVRYTDIYNKLTIYPNRSAIDEASTKLVDDIGEKVRERLSELDIKSRLKTVLEERIRARITGRLDNLQGNRPALGIAPLEGREPRRGEAAGSRRDRVVASELDAAVRASVDPRLEELAAALRARVEAKTDALRAAAQTRIDDLKKRMADKIASVLKSKLDASASLNERWLDPYVGIAARYNLGKAFYLTGKADIGGFGIGSEITWQGSCALGCQITRYIFMEAGYRYLYTDYNHGGFAYDVTQSGAQITTGITF